MLTCDAPSIESPNLGWTARWTVLRPVEEQLRLWNSDVRFKLVPSGRRSGKTELAKRRLAEHLFRETRDGSPGRYFAAAPTREQAKRVFWDDLKALVPPRWLRQVNETELWIQSVRGHAVHVVGLDRPQRIEGVSWDGGVVDEFADCKPGMLDAHLRPALSDREGWLWLIGTPDHAAPAQAEYESLCDQARGGALDDFDVFHWSSDAVLPPEELAAARRTMDPRLFQQEFGGRFVATGTLAFPMFDPALHVEPIEFDPSLPLCWSLDFNIDPMCSGVLQRKGEDVRVLAELTLPDTHTAAAVEAFIDLCATRGWPLDRLELYGDATGAARDSTSGRSDWTIIRNALRNVSDLKMRMPRSNPRVKDTVNAVRARLCDADGVVHLSVDPTCRTLIDDLRHCPWPGDVDRHHALAWLRYFCERALPVTPARRDQHGSLVTSS